MNCFLYVLSVVNSASLPSSSPFSSASQGKNREVQLIECLYRKSYTLDSVSVRYCHRHRGRLRRTGIEVTLAARQLRSLVASGLQSSSPNGLPFCWDSWDHLPWLLCDPCTSRFPESGFLSLAPRSFWELRSPLLYSFCSKSISLFKLPQVASVSLTHLSLICFLCFKLPKVKTCFLLVFETVCYLVCDCWICFL